MLRGGFTSKSSITTYGANPRRNIIPILNIYITGVLNEIKVGVRLINESIDNHLYVDDIEVFSSSLFDIQYLVSSTAFISMWKLNLDINKIKCVKLEAGREEVTNPKSSGNNFVNEYKYLSCVTTRSG